MTRLPNGRMPLPGHELPTKYGIPYYPDSRPVHKRSSGAAAQDASAHEPIYRAWTDEERRLLIHYRSRGVTFREIGEVSYTYVGTRHLLASFFANKTPLDRSTSHGMERTAARRSSLEFFRRSERSWRPRLGVVADL
jgi:hypothetical protein